MADELTVTVAMSSTKGGTTLSLSGTDKVTVSAVPAVRMVADVAVAGGALSLGAVATPGYMIIHNMDASNYINLGNSGDPLPLKVKAGEWQVFRWATGMTPYAAANTATVQIEYFLCSD